MKFYPADWQADELLGMCTLAARGLWIEMIGIMHKADPYGHLVVNGRPPTDTQLAALARTSPDQIPSLLDELENAGVFSRTRTRVIYSRRMTRDERRSKLAVKNGSGGGNPALVRGPKLDRGANPDLVEAVWAKGNGACHYCGITLTRDGNRKTGFEIDHIIPRSKGGTNDIANLVSACPPCNNAKSDNLVDNPLDNGRDKTQKPDTRYQKEDTSPKSPPASGDVIEFEFGEFWKAYPRREDRGHALKAFRTARKKVDQATLMAATKRYADMRRGQDQKFTALAATWLNGERWADERAAEPARNGGYVPMHPGAGG